MNKNEFISLLSDRLYPYLRQSEFKGSGQNLRRQHREVFHIFNVQGSDTAIRCYINLGVHLAFLPTNGGSRFNPRSFKEAECEFRSRLKPPPEFGYGWPYGHSENEAIEIISVLMRSYRLQGEEFFDELKAFPESFTKVTPSDFTAPVRSGITRFCGTPPFVRIALYLGDVAKAKEFAKVGLSLASQSAIILRKHYEDILTAS